MKKRAWQVAVATVVLVAISFVGYRHWRAQVPAGREQILSLMPTNASAVLYVDLAQLRGSPFLGELLAWAPAPTADADYAQFMNMTGFNYERDLDRLAIAVLPRGDSHILFGIAQGRFDKTRISAYVARSNDTDKALANPPSSSTGKADREPVVHIEFIRDDQMAISEDATPSVVLHAERHEHDAAQWNDRFERLAGTPLFAVIRQTGEISKLEAQAPGGLRSPQLSALLDQLEWITIAGKPIGRQLQLVTEGESQSEVASHELTDLLRGIVILAESGLNDAKTRQQLDPAARQAYLDLLESADISSLDRGETKSVRLILNVTPSILKVARTALPAIAPDKTQQNKPEPSTSSSKSNPAAKKRRHYH